MEWRRYKFFTNATCFSQTKISRIKFHTNICPKKVLGYLLPNPPTYQEKGIENLVQEKLVCEKLLAVVETE